MPFLPNIPGRRLGRTHYSAEKAVRSAPPGDTRSLSSDLDNLAPDDPRRVADWVKQKKAA
jgi:hypothetical protein